jgi:type IV fimbrial biogenesis protein FimT
LAKGFTIIELLVALVVVAVLATLAAPSVRDIIFNNRINSAAADLMVDISAARSESARQRQYVGLCTNAVGASANTACDPGSTWAAGWIMYVDADRSLSLNTGDTILRVRQALPSEVVVTPVSVGNNVTAKPAGSMSPFGSWKICDSRVGNYGRIVQVSITGRATVAVATCP